MNKESLITPKYITEEEYFYLTGFTLKEELSKSDDPSKDGLRQLKECEDFVLAYLTDNYDFNESMINDNNIDTFKRVLAMQTQEMISKGYSYKLRDEVKPLLRRIAFMNLRSW